MAAWSPHVPALNGASAGLWLIATATVAVGGRLARADWLADEAAKARASRTRPAALNPRYSPQLATRAARQRSCSRADAAGIAAG